MSTYRIVEMDEDFYLLRVNDRSTRFFEALWEIPEGITYNAYLLKTSGGAVLFDGWKKPYSSMLINALETLVEPSELKYIIVNHMEPDHTGSLEDTVKWAGDPVVLGHPMAGRMMNTYPEARKRFRPVKDGEEIEVGGEKLRFIHTPWLHWPETMVSWIENRRILVSCDVFGGYGAPPALFDDECSNMPLAERWIRKYVVTVIGHYREWINKGLAKITNAGIEPRIIAPGHGLVWRSSPGEIISLYAKLGSAGAGKRKVLVLYGSMYGTVERLVDILSHTLVKKGYSVAIHGYTDTQRPVLSEILADAVDAEVFVIAAPTYEADVFPLVKHTVDEVCWKASAPRKAVVISSYGWGSVAAKHLKKTLEACGFTVVEKIEYNSIGPMGITKDEAEQVTRKILEVLES